MYISPVILKLVSTNINNVYYWYDNTRPVKRPTGVSIFLQLIESALHP